MNLGVGTSSIINIVILVFTCFVGAYSKVCGLKLGADCCNGT